MASRSYSPKTLKLLFGRAKKCAFPGCGTPLTDNPHGTDVVVAQIAHIQGLEPGSARYNPAMTDRQRNAYPNLILLCPTHHTAYIDAAPHQYSVATITKWKADQEKWLEDQLREEMPRVTFLELDLVMQGMIDADPIPSTAPIAVPPATKMAKNGLSHRSGIALGMLKRGEVQQFLQKQAAIMPEFPNRLRAGFVRKYDELYGQGERGDVLFLSLREFAAGPRANPLMQDAALAVLTYLFEVCEVFES